MFTVDRTSNIPSSFTATDIIKGSKTHRQMWDLLMDSLEAGRKVTYEEYTEEGVQKVRCSIEN